MKQEEIFKLENIDPDDISDVLVKVEKSFKFKFGQTDLKDVKTFGELCDIIVSKIELQENIDCTSQQAFYKLREALGTALQINEAEIQPITQLIDLFPKSIRRQKIKQVERILGFSLKILRPKHFVSGFFAILFIISLLGLFASWKFGLIGLITSLTCISVANKFANELEVSNIAALVGKMSRENYINSRRNKTTVNKAEVIKKIEQLFSHDLGLEPEFLTRGAIFN